MPLPARKLSASTKGLSKTYGSPVGPQTPSSHKKRPEWNDRQTDDEKYKLNKDELLKRKKLYVSKHNVLASYNASQSLSAKKRTVSRAPKPRPSSSSKNTSQELPRMRDPLLEMTSLDYLNDEDSEGGSSDSASEESNDDETAGAQRKIRLDETIDMSKFASPAKKELKSPAQPRVSATSSNPTSKGSCTPRRASAGRSPTPKQCSNPGGKKPPSAPRDSSFMKGSDTLVGTDVLEMLRALFGELQYYEELSGRRSVFDFSELNSILDTYSEMEEVDGPLPRKHVSLEGVVRYLIQLVCQSMTYLLQSEVKISQQQTDYESLSKRVEILTTLVTGGSPLNASMRFTNSPAPTVPLKSREEIEKSNTFKCTGGKHDQSTAAAVPSPAAPSFKSFTTPQRREVSFCGIDEMDKQSNTSVSQGTTPQFSHKMGSAASDWLFASPLPRVSFAEETEVGTHNMHSSKLANSSAPSDRETMATPPVTNDLSSEAGGRTVDLFGRELPANRVLSSHSSTPTADRAGSMVTYDISGNSDWTPKVSGRSMQEDHAVNASYDKTENNYYFDMLQSKNDEDETDKLYQENLVSVARKLYAESLERSNLDDSEQIGNSEVNVLTSNMSTESPRLPPRSPAPVTRVEKLQKSLLANRHASSSSRTFLTDLRNSHENESANMVENQKLRIGSSIMEQHSFGTIPPPPPPAPHAAPVHPYEGMKFGMSGADAIRSDQPPRHVVYDATSGSY